MIHACAARQFSASRKDGKVTMGAMARYGRRDRDEGQRQQSPGAEGGKMLAASPAAGRRITLMEKLEERS